MRRVLAVLAVSATASLAMASNFSMPSGNGAFGASPNQPSSMPSVQTDNNQGGTVSVTAIPAPGSAVIAIAGLAALGRRRRDK